ncbi:MAG: hypothetical protein U0625_04570 [Phycisphaerales bacterium]
MAKQTRAERRAIATARGIRLTALAGQRFVVAVLKASERERDPELQFAVLCELSSLDPATLPGRLRKAYVGAVIDFLVNGKRERASEYWMAGDLRGDHWRTPRTTTLLLGLLAEARGEVAARAILHGLKMHHGRLRSERARRTFVARLLEFSNGDPRKRSRRLARDLVRWLARSDQFADDLDQSSV